MTTIYHKHNKQSRYRLCIFKKQTSPWASIYDENSNNLYSFRPLESDNETRLTDIEIINENSNNLYSFRPLESDNETRLTDIEIINIANQFMKKNKLPLFDINKHHIEDANNQYYITQNIDDTIEDTKNS